MACFGSGSGLLRPRRAPTAVLLAAVAALLLGHGDSQEAPQNSPSAEQLKQLAPEQLLQLLGMELDVEDKRTPENLLSFHEFQDVAELDCYSRLVYLVNRTMAVQEEIKSYHNDITGLAGVFWQLLHKAPTENSWVWLLTTSHESLVHKIHGYFAKLTMLALDKHSCLVQELRPAMLEAVAHWKELHASLSSLVWNGFAFGLYGDASTVQELEAKMSEATSIPGNMLSRTWSETLVAGHSWIAQVREWFDTYTMKLAQAMASALPKIEGQTQGTETRLHHQDDQGMFVPYEYLRRKVFKQWALDKGLLRGLIRHVWQPPYDSKETFALADFGAGGGQYSTWLNETGLLQAFAFDGTEQASVGSDGVVHTINLIEDQHLWRTFDWVMCLEVGEHVPKQHQGTLLSNIKRHARKGIVMSWSSDWEGIGHVNCMPQEVFVALVEKETGFVHDKAASEAVRGGCEIEYIARTVAVFRAP